MGVLFDIDHEVGDLSEYDSTVTDGGDLSVTVAAALNSTFYGLQCVIDDTNAIYGEGNLGTPSTTGDLRFRFFIDPNSISANNYTKLSVCITFSSASNSLVVVQMEKTATAYPVWVGTWEDDATWHSTSTSMSDAEHCIEVRIQRASSDVASDGRVDAWLDGVALTAITGLDNFHRFDDFDYIRLGAWDIHASFDGTIYEDELIVNDDGSEIGCEPSGRPRNPAAYYDGPTIF